VPVSFEDIYNRYIGFWPAEVSVSDGRPAAKDGFLFPELNRIYSEVETRIDHARDHWGNVFAWAVFQAAHEYARAALKRGDAAITIRRVPFELIDKYVRKNLADADWDTERSQYIGMNAVAR
jgi:hypothetical protein